MDEHEVTRNIQWLCRDCYERIRDTPRAKQPERRKYSIWETGRWCKEGECDYCKQWKLLTMYEWEDTEAKEERARRQAYRERNYSRKKDTRARYRGRWDEA